MCDLDKKDKKLLFELNINCRQPINKLSKKIQLSKDATIYRIKKLEQKNLILNYRVSINYQLLGFNQFRILFKLININPKRYEDIVSYLKQEKHILIISENDGMWDISILFLTKELLYLEIFFEKFFERFREFIKDHRLSLITNYLELSRNYLTTEKRVVPIKKIKKERRKLIDEIDKQILEILQSNAKEKITKIASILNFSNTAIIKRIRKLEEKNIIEGYKATINVLKLKRDYYGVKIYLNNYTEKDKLLLSIQKIPQVTAIVNTIGAYDIEFDLEVINSKEYESIINNLTNTFHSIREIEFIRTKNFFTRSIFACKNKEIKN